MHMQGLVFLLPLLQYVLCNRQKGGVRKEGGRHVHTFHRQTVIVHPHGTWMSDSGGTQWICVDRQWGVGVTS